MENFQDQLMRNECKVNLKDNSEENPSKAVKFEWNQVSICQKII